MATVKEYDSAPINGSIDVPEGTRHQLNALERMAMQGIAARDREIPRLITDLQADQANLLRQIAERLGLPPEHVGPVWQLDQTTWTLVKTPPAESGQR